MFGPVMLVWFAVIWPCSGIRWIVREPRVLLALNPDARRPLLHRQRLHGFLVLGAVFLAVTGGEALYADMGHFGAPADPARLVRRRASRRCCSTTSARARCCCATRTRCENPFFHLAPNWALYPLVVLATVATVIASQAVISGAFSLTRQAVQLGYLPRIQIVHTSARGDRPDLHPGGELAADDRRHRPGARRSRSRAHWRRRTASR